MIKVTLRPVLNHLTIEFIIKKIGIIHALRIATRDARMVPLKMLTGRKTNFYKDYKMNALAIENNISTISEEAKSHLIILSELLRDVDLESRMMTLIKVEEVIQEEVLNEIQLQSIRVDLELELKKVRKMIFMVERAQYVMETSVLN